VSACDVKHELLLFFDAKVIIGFICSEDEAAI
jgi:hypothetical protein